jgi:hypothetical protein
MRTYNRICVVLALTMTVVAGSAMSANAPPAILGPSNITVVQNSSAVAVSGLSVIDPDAGSNPLSLTLTVTNGTLSMTLPGNVSSNGNTISFLADQTAATTALGTLQYTPNLGYFGSDTITIVVNDLGDGGVNTPAQTTKTIAILVDRAPTITAPADFTTTLNTATPALSFTVDDLDTLASSVGVVGTSDDQTVIPNGNIIIGGSGTSRNVTATPTSTPGVVTITLTATDPSGIASTATFKITVLPNTAPLISGLVDQIIFEDSTAVQTFTIIDGESLPGQLTLKATSSDPTIVQNSSIVFTPNGNNPSVAITPVPFHPGIVMITVSVTDLGGLFSSQTFKLTILHVNHAPILAGGSPTLSSIPANSGTGAFNPGTLVSSFANPLITEHDLLDSKGIAIIGVNSANGAWRFSIDNGANWQVISPLTSNGNATVLTSNALTRVQFVPNTNFAGTATMAFRAWDGTDGNPSGTSGVTVSANGGNSAYSNTSDTATITVTPINTQPSFICGPNQTVNEDSGPDVITAFAFNISPGIFASESTQVLTFNVTNSNNALFSAQPAITASGDLSFTPAPDANGSALVSVVLMDNGGTALGGSDTSGTQTFTITVNAVNDAPSFTLPTPSVTVIKNSSPSTFLNFATQISAGPANESSQGLSFVLTSTNLGLYSTPPTMTSNGNLSFAVAPSAVGTDTVSVKLMDTGGTAFGGFDTSPVQMFTINIVPPNSAPSFTLPATAVSVNEDSGPSSQPAFATAISPGINPNESAQNLTFIISGNTNPSLFSVAPAISALGTLSFTPAPNINGVATISVLLMDDGGTAGGGVDSSPVQTFTITVNPVNDPPSFTLPNTAILAVNTFPSTLFDFATNLSPGPSDESNQAIHFNIVNVSNPALFSVAPSIVVSSITSNGNLTFTPAPGATGTATISINAQDNGGVANGGVDTSANQTFTITLFNPPPNSPPSFTLPNPNVFVPVNAPAQTILNFATNISPGPPFEANQAVTFTITSNSNPGLFSIAPSIVVSSLTSNGNLIFTPAPNKFGKAVITVMAKDNGGTLNGGVDTSLPQTFIINIVGAPTATNSQLTVTEDIVTNGALSATDPQGLPLTYSIVSNGTLGTATIANPALAVFTYTPNLHVAGTDQITFKVNNGYVDSNVATVTIFIVPVNYPPSVDSLDATPNPASVAQSVTFFAAGSDIEDGANLTYAWSFGDGKSATGNQVTHAYATAGVFTATVTITDTGGVSTSKSITITVIAAVYGTGPDTNGNGVADPLEQAILTLDPNANPVPANGPIALHIDNLAIKLNFTRKNSDGITLTGVLAGLQSLAFQGQIVAADIGGVVQAFKLDSKLKAKTTGGTAALAVNRRLKGMRYTFKLKGNFATPLAGFGLTSAGASNAPVTVPLTILFGTSGYVYKANMKYTAIANKNGSAKLQ